MFFPFILWFFLTTRGLISGLPLPQKIIISDNETVILPVENTYLEGNLPYEINNPFNSTFDVRLTDTFSPKKNMTFKTLRHPNSLKYSELLHFSILLFPEKLVMVDSAINRYLTLGYFRGFMPKQFKSSTFKCFDFEFFPDHPRNLLIDCNVYDFHLSDLQKICLEMFLFFQIDPDQMSLRLLNYQIVSNFVDSFDTFALTSYQRKIKICKSTNEVWKFVPWLRINDSSVENPIEIYSIDIISFRVNLLIVSAGNQIVDFDFYEDNPLILDNHSDLSVLNGSLKAFTSTGIIHLTPDSLIKLAVSFKEIEHKTYRVIVITDKICFYVDFIPQTLTLSLNYQLNLDNLTDFQHMDLLQVRDYLLLTFPEKLKLVYITDKLDPDDPRESIQFDYVLPKTLRNGRLYLNPCGHECDGPNGFALYSFNVPGENGVSVVFLIEITQRMLIVSSNTTALGQSMQTFNFTLSTIGFDDLVFTIIYWNFEDVNFYFVIPNQNIDFLFRSLSHNRLYIVDTEQVFIEHDESSLLGPLLDVKLSHRNPVRLCHDLRIDRFSSYRISCTRFPFKDLINKSGYFTIAVTPKSVRILWQNNKDYSLSLAACLWGVGDTINECAVASLYGIPKRITNSMRYKAFLVFQVQDEDFIYYARPEFRNDTIAVRILQGVYCKDFSVVGPLDLIICKNHDETNVFFEFYETSIHIGAEEEIIANKLAGKNILHCHLTATITIYMNMMDKKCLLLLIGENLLFYEVLFADVKDTKTALIKLRNVFSFLNMPFYFFLFPKTDDLTNFLVIYPEIEQIVEYSLLNPYIPIRLRQYPLYNYHFSVLPKLFINNERFLCVKAIETDPMNEGKRRPVLLIYNTSAPSSNLLQKRLYLDEDITDFDNIFIVQDDLYEELSFSDVFHVAIMNYPVLLVEANQEPVIHIIKGMNLIGDLSPEIQAYLEEGNPDDDFSYDLDLYYYNPFVTYYIMLRLTVRVLLNDSVITSNKKVANLISNPLITKDKLKFNLSQAFRGPVENYYFNILSSSDPKITLKFQSYLTYKRDFTDDPSSGEFVQSVEQDGLLFLLTTTKVMIIQLTSFHQIVETILNKPTACNEIRVVPPEILIFCRKTLEVVVMTYSNDSEGNITYIQNRNSVSFTEYFEDYTVVIDAPPNYLLFLAKESVRRATSLEQSLFVFTYPIAENEYSILYLGKVTDDRPCQAFLASAMDFQLVISRQPNDTSSILGLILLSPYNAHFVKMIGYGATDTLHYVEIHEIWEIDLLSYISLTSYQYYKDFMFFNLRVLGSSATEDKNYCLNMTVLVASSLHSFLFDITIPACQQMAPKIKLRKVFRKFYSCQNKQKNRPKVFGKYMGMFCLKEVSEGDEYVLRPYSYFLFYIYDSQSEDDQIESYVSMALPIYQETFNIVFYSKDGKDMLIIPSFLSLFTEYQISPILKFELSGDFDHFEGNFQLIAYNSAYQDMVVLKVVNNPDEAETPFPVLRVSLAILCSLLSIALVCLVVFLIYRKMKQIKSKNLPECNENEVFKRMKKEYLKIDANLSLMVFLKGKKKIKGPKKRRLKWVFDSKDTEDQTVNSNHNLIIKDYF